MSSQRFLSFLFLYALFFLGSCAIIVPPTGGPKDVTPPKPVAYSPENKSLHFKAHKIRITFNEFIQTKSLDKQLIVSPPLKYPPVAVVKGKVLEISIKDTLKNNSTYTFNFGNAIVDNNEGNILKNFEYIVATGDHLDSLSLTGKIQDAFTHDAIKGAYLMLYSNPRDSAIYKNPPSYISLSDDSGHFHIENLASGIYNLIGISNAQNDYLYHPYIEGIAFKMQYNTAFPQTNDTLNLFFEQPPTLKLLKAKAADRGEVMLTFNKPAENLSVKPLNMADSLHPSYSHISYSVTADTAYYWFNTPFIDSLRFIIYQNSRVIDTAFAHSFPNNSFTRKAKKPKVYKLNVGNNIRNGFDFHQPLVFGFSDPVLKVDLKKIHLVQNKDTIKLSGDTGKMPLCLMLNPPKPLLSDSTYKLLILPNAFTDMFGATNDTIKANFSIEDPTYFGTLKLNIELPGQGNYIVQLLNDKGNVYRQMFILGSRSVFFDALLPAVYRVRIIDDANNNGVWDTGNYLGHKQPEQVYYYPQHITIRSNWDLTQTWKVK